MWLVHRRPAKLGEAPFEQTPFGVVVDHRERTPIGLARRIGAAEPAQ